uniref:Uncharacterized protein n=1 Tax=Arion vulgaris TaxID=1028688 RepID=A0A0B7BF09_9EUPU
MLNFQYYQFSSHSAEDEYQFCLSWRKFKICVSNLPLVFSGCWKVLSNYIFPGCIVNSSVS